MILAVYNQYLDPETKELKSSDPMLVAGVSESMLTVEGDLPYPLNNYVSVEELNSFSGGPAIEMFYILAASSYPGYSRISLEGVNENDVKSYIYNNFTLAERLAITRGINSGRVFEKYV